MPEIKIALDAATAAVETAYAMTPKDYRLIAYLLNAQGNLMNALAIAEGK